MKKVLLVAMAAAMLSTGCGANRAVTSAPAVTASAIEAEATKTLLQGFRNIHMAVFAKLDANEDGSIDEYEAGANIDLKDFGKADKNANGKLTKKEFMDYATGGVLFGFMRQNKTDFMKQAREALWKAFQRMDKNGDRLLKPDEMKEDVLKKVAVNLRIDGLHVRVYITEIDDAVFEASDKTGDGQLSQAEFEDYCLGAFVKAINPKFNPTPGPAPAPEPNEPPADNGDGGW